MRIFGIAAALALAVGAAVPPAAAADIGATYRERTVTKTYRARAVYRDEGLLPSCADPAIHSKIAYYFDRREKVYWSSGLQLAAFNRPVELGYRTWGAEFIPRRFCAADTATNDGRRRKVYWVLAQDLAPGTLGTGIDWCVTGLDRHMAFAPDCKMARP